MQLVAVSDAPDVTLSIYGEQVSVFEPSRNSGLPWEQDSSEDEEDYEDEESEEGEEGEEEVGSDS